MARQHLHCQTSIVLVRPVYHQVFALSPHAGVPRHHFAHRQHHLSGGVFDVATTWGTHRPSRNPYVIYGVGGDVSAWPGHLVRCLSHYWHAPGMSACAHGEPQVVRADPLLYHLSCNVGHCPCRTKSCLQGCWHH